MTLAFMFALIFSTTALAAGWNSEYKDNLGNEFHIEKDTITVDKNEGGTLEFHANFLEVFSEQGLQNVKESYRAEGETFPENAAYRMFCMHFKDEGGNKYFCVTDSFYLDANLKPIQTFAYIDKPIQWSSIDVALTDELYKVAKKYI